MTGQISPTIISLDFVIAAIGMSMVLGAVDLLRLPNWAWKKAEEPKVAYTALVVLLPIAGLAMYGLRARPKVKTLVAAGRAASLPFERFDQGAPLTEEEEAASPSPEPMHLTVVGAASSAAMATPAVAAATASPAVAAATATLAVADPGQDDDPYDPEPQPEPATAGAGTFFSHSSGATATATATATRTLRLPASLTSRSYHPKQRASLAEGRITSVPAGWKADPTGRHQFRYWNGSHWTENVADAGVQNRDAVCA